MNDKPISPFEPVDVEMSQAGSEPYRFQAIITHTELNEFGAVTSMTLRPHGSKVGANKVARDWQRGTLERMAVDDAGIYDRRVKEALRQGSDLARRHNRAETATILAVAFGCIAVAWLLQWWIN